MEVPLIKFRTKQPPEVEGGLRDNMKPQQSSCAVNVVKPEIHLHSQTPPHKGVNSLKKKGNNIQIKENAKTKTYNEGDDHKPPGFLSSNASLTEDAALSQLLINNRILAPLTPLIIALLPAMVGILFGIPASAFISDMLIVGVMCWMLWGISEAPWDKYQKLILEETISRYRAQETGTGMDEKIPLITGLESAPQAKNNKQGIWGNQKELSSSTAFIIYIMSNFLGGLIMIILRTQLSSEKKLITNFNIFLYVIIGLGRSLTRTNNIVKETCVAETASNQDIERVKNPKFQLDNSHLGIDNIKNNNHYSKSPPPLDSSTTNQLDELNKLKYEFEIRNNKIATNDPRMSENIIFQLCERLDRLEDLWEQELASLWSSIDSINKDIDYFSYINDYHHHQAENHQDEKEIKTTTGKEKRLKKSEIVKRKKGEGKQRTEGNPVDVVDKKDDLPMPSEKPVPVITIEEIKLEKTEISDKRLLNFNELSECGTTKFPEVVLIESATTKPLPTCLNPLNPVIHLSQKASEKKRGIRALFICLKSIIKLILRFTLKLRWCFRIYDKRERSTKKDKNI